MLKAILKQRPFSFLKIPIKNQPKHAFTIKVFFLLITFFPTIALSVSSQSWASLEYLYGWVQDSPISIPVVTKNNNPSALGVIGEPGTQIIIGKGSHRNAFNLGSSSGGRITLGHWLDSSQQLGIEGSAFGLAESNATFTASSRQGTFPITNIPFFSVETASENVLVFKHPNTASISDRFKPWGLQLNGLVRINHTIPLLFLAGIRYLNTVEELKLNDAIIEIPSLPSGSVLNVRDKFSTRNYFLGLQFGLRNQLQYQHLMLDMTATAAFGQMHRQLSIHGQTNINNQIIIQRIGLFAEPSNIGTYNNNQFAIIPEWTAKISYEVNRYIQPFLSYNVLYLNTIIRPGKQLKRNLNLSQNPLLGGSGTLSGTALPNHVFVNTGMWIQSVGVGIEVSC